MDNHRDTVDRRAATPAAGGRQRPARPEPHEALSVHYAHALDLRDLLAWDVPMLGGGGYGAERPDFLPSACPFVAAPLPPAAGGARFEIWTTNTPCRPRGVGPVVGASGDDFAFGAVTLDEPGATSLEAAVETAYSHIFDFVDELGLGPPIRFWNYLTSIVDEERGMERYRRFNIGRHQAFAERLRQRLPPVASCVGGRAGASVIYFLAAREPARALENPRQVAAYDYPSAYGPRSPCFSRASIHTLGHIETLLISGTASITGHETRHSGDLRRQIDETFENLGALLGVAGTAALAAQGAQWSIKVYLHDPAARDLVEAAVAAQFGATARCLFLCGELCRTDLLVEIEAFCQL